MAGVWWFAIAFVGIVVLSVWLYRVVGDDGYDDAVRTKVRQGTHDAALWSTCWAIVCVALGVFGWG